MRTTSFDTCPGNPGIDIGFADPGDSFIGVDEDDAIVRVPENVASEDAVFGWLYALSSLCFRKARFEPGERVEDGLEV